MNFDQMRNIELKKELKKRGLKGYSSLRKAQLIDYLSTGIHPLKKTETPPTITEGEIHYSPSDSVRYSPTTLDGTTKNLPVNQILSGDCLKVLSSFPEGVFDCCITDPPFNMSKTKGLGWAFSSHVTMQEQWDIFQRTTIFSSQ
ncbi:MAG: hypothetical protein OXM61_02600 [Candidatus Poribacteria bacterium]|nr:hypothetical protein [Candidatus Poribacteria bacterium]